MSNVLDASNFLVAFFSNRYPACQCNRSYLLIRDGANGGGDKTSINIVLDSVGFAPKANREQLRETIIFTIVVCRRFDTIATADDIDPLVTMLEDIGRICTATTITDGSGNEWYLAKSQHSEDSPIYDVDELVSNGNFLGAVQVAVTLDCPRYNGEL